MKKIVTLIMEVSWAGREESIDFYTLQPYRDFMTDDQLIRYADYIQHVPAAKPFTWFEINTLAIKKSKVVFQRLLQEKILAFAGSAPVVADTRATSANLIQESQLLTQRLHQV